MGEHTLDTSAFGAVLLDIGGDVGALVVSVPEALVGQEIEVRALGSARRTHTVAYGYGSGSERTVSAVFPELAAGDYELEPAGGGRALRVTIHGGRVSELAWPA